MTGEHAFRTESGIRVLQADERARYSYLIVSGSPRSGTTFLANILNTHPKIACLHEYRLDDLIKKVESFQKLDENVAVSIVPQQTPTIKIDGSIHEFMYSRLEVVTKIAGDALLTYRERHFEAMFASFFKCVSNKAELQVLGDKMPDLSYLKNNTRDIQRKLGRLQRLFIVRRPEDVIRSSMRRTAMASRGLDPLWTPRTLKEAIFEWVENWEYIVKEARQDPKNVLVVKYESLMDNFGEESSKVASFLEVGNEFKNISSSLPDHLVDFELSADQIAEIQGDLGELSTRWDDLPLSEMIALARRTIFYFGAARYFDIPSDKASKLMLRQGFSGVEHWGVWTCEEFAEIEIRIDKPATCINLVVRPFFANASFDISVNGHPKKSFFISKNLFKRFTVLSVQIAPPSATIRLRIRLKQMKTSADPPYADFRRLGIGLRRVSIDCF